MLLNNRILNGIEIEVAKINLNKANIKMKKYIWFMQIWFII